MTFMRHSMAMIVLVAVACYIIVTAWLSYRWRGNSNEDFMQGGRQISFIVVGIMIFSNYNGIMAIIGTPQRAFTGGLAASWSLIAAGIGFFLYGLFFVKRLYGTGSFTISGAIRKKYGRSTQLIVSLIMIYAMLMLNLNTYISGASVLHEILGTKLPLAMMLIAVVSTIYFSIGGMKSVARTTLIHTVMKYLCVLIIAVIAWRMAHGMHRVSMGLPHYYFTVTGKVGVGTIIGWILTSVGAIFSTQTIAQAIASTSNARNAQRAAYSACLLVLPFGILLGMIGVIARFLFPRINPLYALPVFLGHMNTIAAVICSIGLLAGVFVGVSSCGLAVVALFINDFYIPHCHPQPDKQLRVTRITSIIVGLLPLVFMFYVPNILALSFFAKALRVSIAIVAVMAFYLPTFNSTKVANAALIGTTVLTTVWFILGNPFGINDTYIALITPMIVMVIGNMFKRFATR